MRDLQLQDPTLRELTESADQESDIEVSARRGLKQHKVMTPVLANGRRGALRIQHVVPQLKELRQFEDQPKKDSSPPKPDRLIRGAARTTRTICTGPQNIRWLKTIPSTQSRRGTLSAKRGMT